MFSLFLCAVTGMAWPSSVLLKSEYVRNTFCWGAVNEAKNGMRLKKFYLLFETPNFFQFLLQEQLLSI